VNFQPELARKVMAGEKTVTRRLVSDNPRSPWWRERCALKVDHTYAVCPGRGKQAIGRVRIVSVDLVWLGFLSEDGEAQQEGFASPKDFWDAWTAINGSYNATALVWRVEFAVVEPVEGSVPGLSDADVVAPVDGGLVERGDDQVARLGPGHLQPDLGAAGVVRADELEVQALGEPGEDLVGAAAACL
jgi:hypothetical protein